MILERRCTDRALKLRTALESQLSSGLSTSDVWDRTVSFFAVKKALIFHNGYNKSSREALRLFPSAAEDVLPLCWHEANSVGLFPQHGSVWKKRTMSGNPWALPPNQIGLVHKRSSIRDHWSWSCVDKSHIPLFKGKILYANAYCFRDVSLTSLIVLLDCKKPYVKCAICAFTCKQENKICLHISYNLSDLLTTLVKIVVFVCSDTQDDCWKQSFLASSAPWWSELTFFDFFKWFKEILCSHACAMSA